MIITSGKVIVCSPGRNFVTLKLETSDGVTGLGDATLNGRELAVASYLNDHVLPMIVGLDARRIEDIWQLLYKGAYWRRGPVTMSAIAAVDTALWDIKGKALGTPVYQLLGGASRESVMVYGHASGDTIDEAVSHAADFVAHGYKAVRLQTSVPGFTKTYGVTSHTGISGVRAGRAGTFAARHHLEQRGVSADRPAAVCARPRGARAGRAPAARRPPSPPADRSGTARPRARALSPVLDGGSDAGGEPGGVSAHSPAHHHTAGRGRGVQLDP